MSSWARVGNKIVCIDAIDALVEGSIYTIDRVMHKDNSGNIGVVLAEAKAPIMWNNSVGAYRLSRFRPLITKSQEDDISMFKSLLKPTEVPA